ncbi:MAG TPA: type II secretion system F family protein [Chitinivibrionales bacterium]
MSKFIYTGVSSGGKQTKGEIQAENKNEAISLLRKNRIRVISIKVKPLELNLNLSFGSGVKLSQISRFTRQLSSMTSAGLPLVQCLDILSSQTDNKILGHAVQQISGDIQVGSTLADSMQKHPKIFNQLFCNMVAAGEASGNLDGVLTRLAEYQEKSEALRRKIKAAMTYPVIVGIIAVAVTIIMLTVIVPTFAKMFVDLGGEMPLPTRIVMGISDFLKNYILIIAALSTAGIIALVQYNKTEKGKFNIDSIKLKLPIFGDLERKSAVSRFSQTLATLLSSGVTILEALSITAKTSGNKVIEKGLMRTLEKITGGLTIAEPLKDTGVFPPMVIQMISVGEKTGDLSEMLIKVAEFYKEEVDAAVDALTSIIEPVMICFLGAGIGGILVAMYLPIFNMMGTVK